MNKFNIGDKVCFVDIFPIREERSDYGDMRSYFLFSKVRELISFLLRDKKTASYGSFTQFVIRDGEISKIQKRDSGYIEYFVSGSFIHHERIFKTKKEAIEEILSYYKEMKTLFLNKVDGVISKIEKLK